MTPATQSDVAEVARRLTKAQREAVYWLSDEWLSDRWTDAFVGVLWAVEAILLQPAIIEHRIAPEDGWRPSNEHRLTALGLAIRAHLQENPDAE